jgi:chaperone modulatory protein CbpM
MIDRPEFLILARLETETLDAWIEERWLLPREHDSGSTFSEVDVARAQLIRDLKQDLGVNDEGIGVILDLLDQLHGLRRTLRDLVSVVRTQTEASGRASTAQPSPTLPLRNGPHGS